MHRLADTLVVAGDIIGAYALCSEWSSIHSELRDEFMTPVGMLGRGVSAARPFKLSKLANPEGRLSDDRRPSSSDSMPLKGFILRQVYHNVIICDAYQQMEFFFLCVFYYCFNHFSCRPFFKTFIYK